VNGQAVHATRASRYGARVEAYANLKRKTLCAAEVLGVLADRFLHAERGVARAQGVVFIGYGRSKKHHDPVAHPAMDGPVVTANDGLHSVENRLEQTAVTVRITVSHELRRRGDVRKEHSDLFAFVVEFAGKAADAGRCTLVSESVRGAESWFGFGIRSAERDGRSALITKLAPCP
jgi:hypothetical protein